jgi:1,4-alpha-glucan branching enzyme
MNKRHLMAALAIFASLAPMPAPGQQSHVNLDWRPQKNTENLLPFTATLNSPEVRDDGTVTFRLKAPAAREVLLTGAVLTGLGKGNKPVPFTRSDDGVWTLTVGPLPPDMYQYHFLVDGVRVADPNNTIAGSTAMPPFSTLVVHGSAPA